MTSGQFHDALTLLPEDLVARADEIRNGKPKILPWRRYAAIAASFAVLLASAVMVHTLRQKNAVSEMAVAAPFSAMYDTGAADQAPRMEAAQANKASGAAPEAAAADAAFPFLCVETPVNVHSTASFVHGPSATGITSREELEDYLSKWDKLYLLDPLRDACEIYDEGWFTSHDLILIPVDCAAGPCTVTDMILADGACEVTIAISGAEKEEPTNYHVLLPVEKGAVTDPGNITVIYNSDTNG